MEAAARQARKHDIKRRVLIGRNLAPGQVVGTMGNRQIASLNKE